MKNIINKTYKYCFTLVELLIVISIISILLSVLTISYSSFLKKAKVTKDEQLLYELNSLISKNEINENRFTSSKQVYSFLEENNVSRDSIKSNRDGYQFYFNITKNRFELIDTNEETNIDISSKTYLNAFNAKYNDNNYKGYTGYKTYSGNTTYTYKYFDSLNNVYIGDTIEEENTLYYWIHEPYNYKEYKEYPILTFIHGTNDCLYVQSNESRNGCEIISLDEFSLSNKLSMKMLSGQPKSGCGHENVIRSNLLSDNSLNVMGAGGGDDCFIQSLLNDIKEDESLDCFIILVNLNDELWWENRAQYNLNINNENKVVQQLDIHNAYKVGYGDKIDTKYYSSTYDCGELGINVWFQLLNQLYDELCSKYSINQDRQYIMGHSLGGLATLDMISNYPNRFASAVAVCPASADPTFKNITNITQTNVLCMHGKNDGWVSSKMGETFINALNNVYPGHGKFISVENYGHSDAFLSSNTYEFGYEYVKDFIFNSEIN